MIGLHPPPVLGRLNGKAMLIQFAFKNIIIVALREETQGDVAILGQFIVSSYLRKQAVGSIDFGVVCDGRT